MAWLGFVILTAAPASAAVTFSVVGDWGSGFQAELTIRNDGPQSITHWRVEFDLAYQIGSIWNAEIVQHAGTRYVIKHPAWSDTIRAGESVQFGFIGTPGGVSSPPTTFTVYGDDAPPPPPPPPPPPANSTRVTFARTTDWGSGYNAEIVIHAPSSSGLNGWRLEFDLPDAISGLWNGVMTSPSPRHYVVRNESWNGTIAPGGSVAIGFGASVGASSGPPSGC